MPTLKAHLAAEAERIVQFKALPDPAPIDPFLGRKHPHPAW